MKGVRLRKITPLLLTVTLLFIAALLHITGADRVFRNALHPSLSPPPRFPLALDVTQTQLLYIEDDWEGTQQFSPISVHASLTPGTNLWYGEATLSVRSDKRVHGQWQTGYVEKTVPCTVPAFVMQRVLAQVSRAPLVPITLEPEQTPAALHPSTTLNFQTPAGEMSLHSTSTHWDHAPWQVQTPDGKTRTRSSEPGLALRLLRPYLHENELAALKTQAAAPQ